MNKVIVKSPEFYRLARELSKCQNQLNKSRIEQEKPGYIMDQWGRYVPEVRVNKLIETYRKLALVDDKQEAQAIRYGLAGLFLILNRFDEAESEFKALAQDRPDKNILDIFNLAIIAAKRGNFHEAKRLATILAATQDSAYQMSEERIQEEYEGYRRIAKV